MGRLIEAGTLRKLAGGPTVAIVKATKTLNDGQRVDTKAANKLIDDVSSSDKPETYV